MRRMAERKVVLLVLWLVAMSSVDLSMGFFPTFKLSTDNRVKNANEKVVANSKMDDAQTNPYTDLTINPNAQDAWSNVAQNHGFEVNTAPSKEGYMRNTRGLKQDGAYVELRINPNAQAAWSNVARNNGFEVNTAPSKQGYMRNTRGLKQDGGSTEFRINPNAQAAWSNIARNNGFEVNTAPSKEGYMANKGELKQGDEDTEFRTNQNAQGSHGGDMENQGGAMDRASQFPSSHEQYGGRDYMVEKRNQRRKLAEIIFEQRDQARKLAEINVEKRDQARKIEETPVGDQARKLAEILSEKMHQTRKLAEINNGKRHQGGKLVENIPSRGKDRESASDKAYDAYAAYAYATNKAAGAINIASYMAGEVLDNAPDMARATKTKVEEMADYAMNKASDLTGNTKNKAFNTANNANIKAQNMASDAMNKGANVDVKDNLHYTGENVKQKADGAMNTRKGSISCNAEVAEKYKTASEYDKHKEDRTINNDYLSSEKAATDALDRATEAYAYASNKIDEKIKMATKRGGDAKKRWDDAVAQGKDKTFERYLDAKTRALEAYQFAKNTLMEIAKENYEAAKEKGSDATENVGAYMGDGLMGDGIWEL